MAVVTDNVSRHRCLVRHCSIMAVSYW